MFPTTTSVSYSDTQALTSTQDSEEHCPGPRLTPSHTGFLPAAPKLRPTPEPLPTLLPLLSLVKLDPSSPLPPQESRAQPTVLSSDYPPLQAPRGDVCPGSRLQAGWAGDHTWFCPSPQHSARCTAGTRTCDWFGCDYLMLLGAVQSWEGPIIQANPKSAPQFQRGLRNSQTLPSKSRYEVTSL